MCVCIYWYHSYWYHFSTNVIVIFNLYKYICQKSEYLKLTWLLKSTVIYCYQFLNITVQISLPFSFIKPWTHTFCILQRITIYPDMYANYHKTNSCECNVEHLHTAVYLKFCVYTRFIFLFTDWISNKIWSTCNNTQCQTDELQTYLVTLLTKCNWSFSLAHDKIITNLFFDITIQDDSKLQAITSNADMGNQY